MQIFQINLKLFCLQDKFQFLQIYINHYKMTIGVSEEERAIYNKYLETEDNEDLSRLQRNYIHKQLLQLHSK